MNKKQTKNLVEWLRTNCGTTWRKETGYRWYLNKDAIEAWDGSLDDRLPLYTDEEIVHLYRIEIGLEKAKPTHLPGSVYPIDWNNMHVSVRQGDTLTKKEKETIKELGLVVQINFL